MLSLFSFFRRPSRDPEPDTPSAHVVAGLRTLHGKVSDPFTAFNSRRPLTPTTQTQPQNASPLLSLPAELRSRIWSLVAGPSRTIFLGSHQLFDGEDYSKVARVRAPEYHQSDERDVLGWETALLCTCKQIYVEVLPTLLHTVKINPVCMRSMMRLPELLPPHKLCMLRNVQFGWLLHNPSFYGYRPDVDAGKRPRRGCVRISEKAKDTALRLRAICTVLGAMPGLEVVNLDVWLVGSKYKWNAVEVGIMNEINTARQGRQGWKVVISSHYWEKSEVGEQNMEGLTLIRKMWI